MRLAARIEAWVKLYTQIKQMLKQIKQLYLNKNLKHFY